MAITTPRGYLLLGLAFVVALLIAGCAGERSPAPRAHLSSHGATTIKTFRPMAGSPMAGGGG